jgi:chromate reductase
MINQAQNPVSLAATRTTRILAIPGSLRAESYNRKLLEAAQALAPRAVAVELWGGLKELPPFDEDDERDPGDAVLALREAIEQADAVLIATPQYNASLPGQLKNALDWASRPYGTNALRGKPVAVIGASPSPSGAARAQAEVRIVLGAIGAEVLDAELALAHVAELFDADRALTSAAHRERLVEILAQLAYPAREAGDADAAGSLAAAA